MEGSGESYKHRLSNYHHFGRSTDNVWLVYAFSRE